MQRVCHVLALALLLSDPCHQRFCHRNKIVVNTRNNSKEREYSKLLMSPRNSRRRRICSAFCDARQVFSRHVTAKDSPALGVGPNGKVLDDVSSVRFGVESKTRAWSTYARGSHGILYALLTHCPSVIAQERVGQSNERRERQKVHSLRVHVSSSRKCFTRDLLLAWLYLSRFLPERLLSQPRLETAIIDFHPRMMLTQMTSTENRVVSRFGHSLLFEVSGQHFEKYHAFVVSTVTPTSIIVSHEEPIVSPR